MLSFLFFVVLDKNISSLLCLHNNYKILRFALIIIIIINYNHMIKITWDNNLANVCDKYVKQNGIKVKCILYDGNGLNKLPSSLEFYCLAIAQKQNNF